MKTVKMTCHRCGQEDAVYERLGFDFIGIHRIKGACKVCNHWLLWVPYDESVIVYEALNESFKKQEKADDDEEAANGKV